MVNSLTNQPQYSKTSDLRDAYIYVDQQFMRINELLDTLVLVVIFGCIVLFILCVLVGVLLVRVF